MFNLGKAISGAPIWSGVTKLPKAPKASGTIPRKTIIVPCMAPNMLYKSPVTLPSSESHASLRNIARKPGSGLSGEAILQRITIIK